MTFLEITSFSGFAIRLLIAILLGFSIGLERQWTRHQAGILTNTIVCMGSFIFASYSLLMPGSDPTRIAAQVVSGIGFLGAGVILREGLNVRGLNTAATVWATSAVGVMCCADDIYFALLSGAAIIVCHLCFHPISLKVTNIRFKKGETSHSEKTYQISVVCTEDAEHEIREKLIFLIKNESKVLLKNLESHDTDDDKIKIKAIIKSIEKDETRIEKIISNLGVEQNVIASGWKKVDD